MQQISNNGEIKSHKFRKPWIDALRALAVLFVVFGHQIPDINGFFVFTSPIKIPLFFMISGYLFKSRQTTYQMFFKSIFFRLIIPWVCLTIPGCLLNVFSQGIVAIKSYIGDLLAGDIAWYMPCCIIAETLFFIIQKATKNTAQVIVGVLILCCIGFLAARFDVLNYAMINRALIVQVFLLEGHLYRENEEKFLKKVSWLHVTFLCGIYVIVGLISLKIWPNSSIDVHMNAYYNYPVCFTMIFLGCFTLFVIAEKATRIPSILLFVGQNTLVYYLLSSINISVFVKLLSLIKLDLSSVIPNWLLYAIVITIISCIICGIEAVFINRFIPEIAGKKRMRKVKPILPFQ